MRKTIRQHDIIAWAESFMSELAHVEHHAKQVKPAKKS